MSSRSASAVHFGPLPVHAISGGYLRDAFERAQTDWQRTFDKCSKIQDDARQWVSSRLTPYFSGGLGEPLAQKLSKSDTIEGIRAAYQPKFPYQNRFEAAISKLEASLAADPPVTPDELKDLNTALFEIVSAVTKSLEELHERLMCMAPPRLWLEGCGGTDQYQPWPIATELDLIREIGSAGVSFMRNISRPSTADRERPKSESTLSRATASGNQSLPLSKLGATLRLNLLASLLDTTKRLFADFNGQPMIPKPRLKDFRKLEASYRKSKLSLDPYDRRACHTFQPFNGGVIIPSMRSTYTIHGKDHREQSDKPFTSDIPEPSRAWNVARIPLMTSRARSGRGRMRLFRRCQADIADVFESGGGIPSEK